jgi:bifunctional non-homologous end joining protein LigD
VTDEKVRLSSRNGVDVTASYPELADLPRAIRGDAVLDGEIVAMNKAGRPDFGLLQSRMNVMKPKDVSRAATAAPVQFLIFDILELNGESLRDRGYDERREILESLVRADASIHVPPAFDGDVASAVSTSRALGLEGIMAKRRDSAYSPGTRSRAWLKVKHTLAQEVVIGGWRPGSGARAHRIGSLLMGIPDAAGLRYVGRVGSGFSEKQFDALESKFRRLERASSPFSELPATDASDAHFITPNLVGEVLFAEWTPTGKLRHPRWRAWRPDKSPGDVTPES